MATSQNPLLFLSHSGIQKDFTRRLYRELLHVNHNPFFDQDARDSLPKGEPFPSHIVEACRACKLGIVVVSHEYIESLWPMLELQQLFFHNPSSPNNVYPVFYTLKPADLSKQENLTRWQSAWDRQAPSWHAKVQDLHMAASVSCTSLVQPTLDISSWPKALEMLRYQSGEILPDNKDEHAFIQTIVRNICSRLPPPDYFLMGDHFKGAEHIQQEIHELFERIDDPRRMPITVGVYGVGGSGKTTVCKYMLSFYSKEYPGSCCFIQFPSREEDEGQLLVKSIKEVLAERGSWAKESLDKIHSAEQAMPHLQDLLRRYMVFLVLDNVWDWALQRAKQIVTMDYMPGSRMLVTARSERLLQTLSASIRIHVNEAVEKLAAMQITHVPSISEEEAVEALMAYSLTSSQYVTNVKDLWGLARSCFFNKKCHPLLLKAVGAKLRHLGGHTRSAQDWNQLISRLQAHCIHHDEQIEDTVLKVLKTSFDALHSKLKNTFLNLGTCVPKLATSLYAREYESLSGSSEWLSMLSHNESHTIEDIRDQLVELEYHGLIQVNNKGDVVIHDLQMMLIETIVRENNGAPRCLFFEGDVATLSTSDWTRLRYISAFLEEGSDLIVFGLQKRGLEHMIVCLPFDLIACFPFDLIGCFHFDQRATSPNWSNIEVLRLQSHTEQLHEELDPRHAAGKRFSMNHMQSLRYLELTEVNILKALGDWHGAPNLVSVKLKYCSNLQNIESMACLSRLESLVIEDCMSSGQYVTNLSSCENLKRLVIRDNDHLKHLASLGHLPKLQELNLSWSRNLVDVGTLSTFTSLQRCTLRHTGILKFPDFNSINLRELDLSNCKRLQSMEGSVCGLTALEELCFSDCIHLESIPDLKPLVNLRKLYLGNCHALKEVKLGDATVPSLEQLSLVYSCRFLMSCSPLPISAFTNLRWLRADGGGKWGISKIAIDVGSNLPVSLDTLILQNFETAEETTLGLSALVNLNKLYVKRWSSLTKITGLGALTKLQRLEIWECPSLREVGHWEAPFLSNLKSADIWDCPKLETLSTMMHLKSLKRFSIHKCPMVQMETLPRGLEWFRD